MTTNEKRELMVSLGSDLETFSSADSLGISAIDWMHLLNGYTKVGYWCVDIKSGLVNWSPRTYEIHGLPYKEGPVVMTDAVKKYHPEDMPLLMSLIEQSIENRCGFSFRLRLIDAAGKVKEVASIAAFRSDTAGNDQLYGLFHEVTPANKGMPTLHSLANNR